MNIIFTRIYDIISDPMKDQLIKYITYFMISATTPVSFVETPSDIFAYFYCILIALWHLGKSLGGVFGMISGSAIVRTKSPPAVALQCSGNVGSKISTRKARMTSTGGITAIDSIDASASRYIDPLHINEQKRDAQEAE